MLRALLIAGALLVGGCSSSSAPSDVGPSGSPGAVPTSSAPAPVTVSIPSVGLNSPPLLELHLTAAGELQVPPLDQPGVGGWYADGVRPGALGPAVLAAHVSGRVAGRSTPGLFARLHELRPGALVHVDRVDGSRVTFRVVRVETYAKTGGIPARVYADTPGPELRLITCGGSFDPAARSYRSNVVAFAVLA